MFVGEEKRKEAKVHKDAEKKNQLSKANPSKFPLLTRIIQMNHEKHEGHEEDRRRVEM